MAPGYGALLVVVSIDVDHHRPAIDHDGRVLMYIQVPNSYLYNIYLYGCVLAWWPIFVCHHRSSINH